MLCFICSNFSVKTRQFSIKICYQIKYVYFDVLGDIVNIYNSTVPKTIKMKPIDVKSDSYTEYNEDSNEKDPKYKAGDRVRISK